MDEGSGVPLASPPPGEPAGEARLPPDVSDRNWAAFLHLSALSLFMGFVPIGNLIAPLVIWLVKRHEHPFIDRCGRAAINFQISMSIYLLIVGLLTAVFVGFLLIPFWVVLFFVAVIRAAMKASNGEVYDYPASFQFIR